MILVIINHCYDGAVVYVLPAAGPDDRIALAALLPLRPDLVALSFVHRADDILELHRLLVRAACACDESFAHHSTVPHDAESVKFIVICCVFFIICLLFSLHPPPCSSESTLLSRDEEGAQETD